MPIAYSLFARLAFSLLCVTLGVQPCFAQPKNDPSPVVVAKVTVGEVKSGQRAIGFVFPVRRSTIGSAVDGRVESFLVNTGDAVKKGQTIAQLRTGTLEIEQKAAAAELDLAKQSLAELVNGSLPEEIKEAEANMMAARASFKNAKTRLDRLKALASGNATSATELDDAKQRFDDANFAVAATEALYQKIKRGARVESISQAQAQVELQTQRLNLIDDRISKFKIVAPFSGHVSTEFTEVGAWIKQGDPIVELIQLDQVEVQVYVTAEVAVAIKKNAVVRVEIAALRDQLLTGEITQIVPNAVGNSRTFPVNIRLANKMTDGSPLILAGMRASVEFPAGRSMELPLVPKDALVLNGAQRSVYVVDTNDANEKTVRKVDVDLGVAIDDRIQVRGDLKADELVVIVGNERLRPNANVKVVRTQNDENK